MNYGISRMLFLFYANKWEKRTYVYLLVKLYKNILLAKKKFVFIINLDEIIIKLEICLLYIWRLICLIGR